ncbi:IS630 family transposase [Streptomyces sp. ALI-76-A]|nr:IS630 family transposase [Streptomyces sp. ALI-76-A]MDL5198908.1 IS630 family transposase [Streptomyces sp. ALI-76-A]
MTSRSAGSRRLGLTRPSRPRNNPARAENSRPVANRKKRGRSSGKAKPRYAPSTAASSQGSMVQSVDEKTAIAARSRKQPGQPPGPGRVRRREFEYLRHDTVPVTVALDVHTGQVVMEELERNDCAHFIRFLARLQRCVPAGLTIHLIPDNGSSHTSKATRVWLKRHPRIVPHYTPKHTSWLNQVEILSLLARAVLRHGDFSSRTDLLEKVSDFAIVHNKTACPFR